MARRHSGIDCKKKVKAPTPKSIFYIWIIKHGGSREEAWINSQWHRPLKRMKNTPWDERRSNWSSSRTARSSKIRHRQQLLELNVPFLSTTLLQNMNKTWINVKCVRAAWFWQKYVFVDPFFSYYKCSYEFWSVELTLKSFARECK